MAAFDTCTYTHGSGRCWNCGAHQYTSDWKITWSYRHEWSGSTFGFHKALLDTLPKNHRWWHALAPRAAEPVLRVLDGVREAMRRTQERHPASQRTRRKRRRFVHQLRAA